MHDGPRLRPSVLIAREQLAQGRAKLKKQHDSGSPGVQVCARLTDLLDSIVLDLFNAALAEIDDPELTADIALVPHGGYGRRDVAPFSDVDLMLLYRKQAKERVEQLASTLSQQIVDVGLTLGFSTRTSKEATDLAIGDAAILTSLAESRFLVGSVKLFTRFYKQLRLRATRHDQRLIQSIEEARRTERRQYGETVYLLKPNVKRSRGCLRDIQLLRWIAFARYGECDFDTLERSGHLAKKDRHRIRAASDFLLRVRNELHFNANRSQDLLDKGEQLRIAELHEYDGWEGGLPVESFMREYFEHTSQVRYITAHFIATAKQRKSVLLWLGSVFSQKLDDHIRMGPVHIWATEEGKELIRQRNLSYVMRMMELANLHSRRIDHPTWQEIRETMLHGDVEVELTHDVVQRFLSLLSQPGRLADLLRRLHELRVLEKIVPAMKHARCLLQFNEYHKYTVDEHTFRALDHVTNFAADTSLGRAYRKIRDKRLLHLALLLHDLGKGFPQDHSELGLEIAKETCHRLGLSDRDSAIVQFLVHKHLLMAHLAFRRDIDDESTVLQLAREVGSPVVLQMLYVLTAADVAAVGPDVLNDWKTRLLTTLYRSTRAHIAGDTAAESPDLWVTEQRNEIQKLVPDSEQDSWWQEQFESLPPEYLRSSEAPQVVQELRGLRELQDEPAITWSRYLHDRNVVEYTVGTNESITVGIFHRLTGALSSNHHQIHSAKIHTLAHGLVLDRFYVTDQTFSGEPPESRTAQIEQALKDSLLPDVQKPQFRESWYNSQESADRDLSDMPTEVHFDNNTSESYTVVDIFTVDRMGLLYNIARTLYQCGLSIHVAKIGTYLDQVVDVFYVSDEEGRKIETSQQQSLIRNALLHAIEGS